MKLFRKPASDEAGQFDGLSLRHAWTALLDLAMPRLCIVCERPLSLREDFICLPCLCELPLTHFWERTHNPMADKFNEKIQQSLFPNGKEPGAFEPYAYAAGLFFYNSESAYRRIPWQLKYRGDIAAGKYFSRMLGSYLAQSQHLADVDVIIPVPLHWTRRMRRGYNQAEVIAQGIAEAFATSPEVRTDILRRSRRTRTQTRLSLEGKQRNVQGAFAARPRCTPLPKHILLVDDTFTTGATLNACRQALRSVFPEQVRISVATLAVVRRS